MRIAIWDVPVRLFHWVLAVLVVFSFVSGKVGGAAWLEWHMRSGETILALLGFRLMWGFVGSDTARFAGFLRGPRAALHYARETRAGRHLRAIGHNPLGAWMVVAMLAILALQAFSGLFIDDEISTQGPLYAKASNAWIERMSAIHHVNQYVVLGAVLLHIIAIIVYWKVLRTNLVAPMVQGWMESDTAPAGAPRMRSSLLALAFFVASAAAVYALVVVYPATP